MSQLAELGPAVEAVFRQRMEEVVAGEVVTELGAKRKTSKPKLLVLCRPLGVAGSSSLGGSSLNIVVPEKDGQRVRVKQTFVVDRLRDITHDGSFDATFNFGASGMFSVSFESHIQREMFVAALRRQQTVQGAGAGGAGGGAVAGGVGGGPGRRVADDLMNIRGVLSAAVGAEVEADAASRVRRLRQEKRRVFSTDEEQHLLKSMGGAGFDDVRGFQGLLLKRQKEAELKSTDALVRSADAWDSTRNQMLSLVQDIEELESRIEQYSSHLMSKKGVIQQIEHRNNTLRQKQRNLEELYVIMAELRDQLRLPPATMSLLSRLRAVPDEGLVAFFSEGSTAAVLSGAMRHMQGVLCNPRLDTDYPIAAVAERKTFFLEQRRLVARRSQSYILSLIAASEQELLADRSRFSRDDHLVWRLHTGLSTKLLGIRDIVGALPRIDPEGFTSALRRYRTGMQRVYALEIFRFLKGMRRQVKRVNTWRGPFLLGSSETKDEAMAARMETAQAGETPRMWRGRTPAPSPALTPRMMSGYDDDRGSLHGGGGGAGGSSHGGSHAGGVRMLSVEYPSSPLFNTEVALYAEARTLRQLDARAASGSVVSSLKSLTPAGSGGGGYVRPDLGFAIVLESAMIAILHEEHMLRVCFGIGEQADPAEEGTGVSAGAVTSPVAGKAAAAAAATGNHSIGSTALVSQGGDDAANADAAAAADSLRRMEQDREARALTIESLLELFGGDKLSSLDGADGGPGGGAAFSHSRTGSRDLGLPPRYPQSPRGGGGLSTGDFFGPGADSRRLSGSTRMSSLSGRGLGLDGDGAANGGGGAENAAYASLTEEEARLVRTNFLVREVVEFAKFLFDKCDRVYAIPALCMVKAYRHGRKPRTEQSAFCQGLLRQLETVVAGAMMRFVAEQTESISRCRRKYLVRSTALLHCFAKMPALILRMEAVHNSLADDVCDRTEYTSIVSSLVDQSFDALDFITNVKGGSAESGQENKLKLSELLAKKVHYALEGIASDTSSLKRGFVQQYRHHAFFCAFYASLPQGSYAAELLQEHNESSKLKRDRYEELYLTRVLLVRDFPAFGVFTLSAEDLSLVYSQEELRHHRALAADAVRKIAERLGKEMRAGIRSSAARMKSHFLHDVEPGGTDESFHKTLLQRTWQHFAQLILQKLDFLRQLLTWPMYQGIEMSIERGEVEELLSSF